MCNSFHYLYRCVKMWKLVVYVIYRTFPWHVEIWWLRKYKTLPSKLSFFGSLRKYPTLFFFTQGISSTNLLHVYRQLSFEEIFYPKKKFCLKFKCLDYILKKKCVHWFLLIRLSLFFSIPDQMFLEGIIVYEEFCKVWCYLNFTF